MTLRAVSFLYDLGRAAFDGRSIDRYLRWLNRTLRLPVPFTLYLDPGIDPARVAPKPGDEIVPLPWEGLATAQWLPRVEEICRTRHRFKARDDLTYLLPKYIVTTMAKFDLLAREAAAHPAVPFFLWIDAGAARFSGYDFGALRLREDFAARLVAEADLALSARPHLRDYLNGRRAPQLPGRCDALVAATAMLFRREAIPHVRQMLYDHVERDWFPRDLWDTEQTALGELILARRIATALHDETGNWIGLLDGIFEPTSPLPRNQRWTMPRAVWRLPAPVRAAYFAWLDGRAAFRRWRYGGPENREIAALIRAE